jgi:hypothetical protein
MKIVTVVAFTMLGLAGCAQEGGGSTTLNQGDRIVPDSAGRCTQTIGAQTFRVKCPDQK